MPTTRIAKKLPFLQKCFGRRYRGKRRKNCICPPRLKAWCERLSADDRISDHRSALPITIPVGVRPRGYFSFDKRIASKWNFEGGDPPVEVKWTYVFLLAKADKYTKWVPVRLDKLAEARDLPKRTLVEHLKKLEGFGLILRIPFNWIHPGASRREKTVVLLDLPRGFGGLSEDEEAKIDAAIDEVIGKAYDPASDFDRFIAGALKRARDAEDAIDSAADEVVDAPPTGDGSDEVTRSSLPSGWARVFGSERHIRPKAKAPLERSFDPDVSDGTEGEDSE